jgi:hypothetical protein
LLEVPSGCKTTLQWHQNRYNPYSLPSRTPDVGNTMWCNNCGQDVPRVAAPGSGMLCCLRCGKPVGEEPSARSQLDCAPGERDQLGRQRETQTISTPVVAPSGYDAWEWDEELKHIGRVIGSPEAGGAKPAGRKHRRVDAAHRLPAGRHWDGRTTKMPTNFDPGAMLLGAAAWLALTVGLVASTCGGVLVGWSVVAGRGELWSVGLPIAVGGLVAMVVGIVLLLARLLGEQRATAARLERFGSEIVRVRRDAAMAGGPGGAFYAHLAEGATPQLLLSDLGGQLETLVRRLDASETTPDQPEW